MWLSCCGCPTHGTDEFSRANGTDVSTGSGLSVVEESGDWSIAGTSYATSSDANAILLSGVDAPDIDTMRLSVAFSLHSTGASIKVYFDWTDASNHSYLELTRGTSQYFALWQVVAGVPTEIGIGQTTNLSSTSIFYLEVYTNDREQVFGRLFTSAPTASTVGTVSAFASGTYESGAPSSTTWGVGNGGTNPGDTRIQSMTIYEQRDDCVSVKCAVCQTQMPTQYQVDITGATGTSSNLNGTWYLDRDADGTCANFSYDVNFALRGKTADRLLLSIGYTAGTDTTTIEFTVAYTDASVEVLWRSTFSSTNHCAFTSQTLAANGAGGHTAATITINAIGG